MSVPSVFVDIVKDFIYNICKSLIGGEFMENIAHIDMANHREQPLIEHLQKVADLAEKFALQDAAFGKFVGFSHDIGKSRPEFQLYIRGLTQKDAYHAPAGARFVFNHSSSATKYQKNIAAMIIAGHHAGLYDISKYLERIKINQNEHLDIGTAVPEIPSLNDLPLLTKIIKWNYTNEFGLSPDTLFNFSVMFYTRMLFSCLVDADFLDTEKFMAGREVREKSTPLDALSHPIRMHTLQYHSPKTPLDEKRTEILDECINAGKTTQYDLFTLTVPTGGGKTFDSLAFSLELAKQRNFRRIIYVIPYSSIIEQTASNFRDIVGDCVLEHHYQAPWVKQENPDKDTVGWQEYASENWDAPLIVTTNNQFLESLFSARPSVCRKLHNIEGSVIIFDEAQMLPRRLLLPSLLAVQELVRNYHCAAVFCTATQPVFDKFFQPHTIHEITQHPAENYTFFQRCHYVHEIGEWSPAQIAEGMQNNKQALAIFNTKRGAEAVFDELPTESRFYLSTDLYPCHRKAMIREIRKRLADGLPCYVASTSIIEAGVDVDFETVWRELAGLDHIIQAGGRCNRGCHHSKEDSVVHVFSLSHEFSSRDSDLLREIGILNQVLELFPDAIDSPDAIRNYFRRLYAVEQTTKESQLDLSDYRMKFRSLSTDYRIIKDSTYPILIMDERLLSKEEFQKLEKFLQALRYGKPSYRQLRMAHQYMVNAHENRYNELRERGLVETFDGTDICLLKESSCYDLQKGLLHKIPFSTTFA